MPHRGSFYNRTRHATDAAAAARSRHPTTTRGADSFVFRARAWRVARPVRECGKTAPSDSLTTRRGSLRGSRSPARLEGSLPAITGWYRLYVRQATQFRPRLGGLGLGLVAADAILNRSSQRSELRHGFSPAGSRRSDGQPAQTRRRLSARDLHLAA